MIGSRHPRRRRLGSIGVGGALLCLLASGCTGGGRQAPEPASSRGATAQSQPSPVVQGCASGHDQLTEQNYRAAAATFDGCAEARPDEAYAYYYAGMAYREIGRVDLMTLRFERFIELAPGAPERPRVQAILHNVSR